MHCFFYEEMCDTRLFNMLGSTSHPTEVLIHAGSRLYIIERRMASSQFPPIHRRKNKRGLALQWMTAHGSCSSGDGVGGPSGETHSKCACVWPHLAGHMRVFALRWCIFIHICMYVHAFEFSQLCCTGWKTCTSEQTPGEISFCSDTGRCCQGH